MVGLCCTILVMVYFQHAQPALLYLVPAVLISSLVHSYIRGEFALLSNFVDLEYVKALAGDTYKEPVIQESTPAEQKVAEEQALAVKEAMTAMLEKEKSPVEQEIPTKTKQTSSTVRQRRKEA